MQGEEGHEERQGHYYEKWQTGNTGRLSFLRDKDV